MSAATPEPPLPAHVLVVAKAPVAGLAKTRLGAVVGMDAAAALAAAALLDTLEAAWAYAGGHASGGPDTSSRCHVALAGSLDEGVDAAALHAALRGWQVRPQRGDGFDERLAAAHADVPGPVVQVGMDTPQVTPALLAAVVAGLDAHDAVLAPAPDGGWWALALRDPTRAAVLRGVPMSTPGTCAATRAALEAAGLSVGDAPALVDVDEVADAVQVARLAPTTRFARLWHASQPPTSHPSGHAAASDHSFDPRSAAPAGTHDEEVRAP